MLYSYGSGHSDIEVAQQQQAALMEQQRLADLQAMQRQQILNQTRASSLQLAQMTANATGTSAQAAIGGGSPTTVQPTYNRVGTTSGSGTSGVGTSLNLGGSSSPVNYGTTGTTQSLSEQLRYDPWSAFRDDAAAQLNQSRTQTDPSQIYQTKLAQMVNGTFSPDDPSYQWRFDQGQQAVERSMAARGLLNSGNAAIELQNYGQGAASQEYGAQFGRLLQGLSGVESAYNTQQNRLMEMAGVNINPVAGGQLNVAQQEAGTHAQQVANQYDLGLQDIANRQFGSGSSSLGGTNWAAIFGSGGGGGGGGSIQPSSSWDQYFAANSATNAQSAQTPGTIDYSWAHPNLQS